MAEIRELENYLRGFATARQWETYHTPANLAKSISIEANELLELFQWTDAPKEDPAREMAKAACLNKLICSSSQTNLLRRSNSI